MTQADLERFYQVMAATAELHGRSLSEAVMAMYFEDLAPYPMEAVVEALRRHRRNPQHGQFFPKPADLIRALEGSHEERALMAFNRLVAAMDRVGAYQSPDFSDRVLHQVVEDMGGWPLICRTWLTEERSYRLKEFSERYRALISLGRLDGPKYLVGLQEESNQERFPMWVPTPALIGERGELISGGVAAGWPALPEGGTQHAVADGVQGA